MNDLPAGEVVVGVDGAGGSASVLDWAAREAVTRHTALVIAHSRAAGHDGRPQSPPAADTGQLLAAAEAAVRRSAAACPIRTLVADEPPLRMLQRLSATAGLVVLGSHGAAHEGRFPLGDVAFRVAAHAICPVAVLPAEWLAGRRPDAGEVVVGVSVTSAGRAALELAWEYAHRHGVALRAVRTVSRVDWSAGVADRLCATGSEVLDKQRELVVGLIEPLGRRYPDVAVSVEVGGSSVFEALSAAAHDAQVLVVGCRFAQGRHYSRLGPTTTRILHHAPCPVIVTGNGRRAAEQVERPPLHSWSSSPAT